MLRTMKPLAWLGKKVLARVEARPSFQAMQQREERVAPVRRAVYHVVQKPIDDATAKAELEEKLAGKRQRSWSFLATGTL
jgi:hypothetical protein